MVASFRMMTDEVYKASDGTAICETTWHHVTAWEGKEVYLDGLGRGSLVHVEGRIRNSMYTASDGKDHQAAMMNGRVVTVKSVDGIGQIHLEESGLALIPGTDEYEVL